MSVGFDRPLDRFLWALRLCGLPYRAVPVAPADVAERVVASCPRCRTAGCLPLTIIEPSDGAEVVVRCDAGCSEADVRRALVAELCDRAANELRDAA